jgi:hydrogenase-4 component E
MNLAQQLELLISALILLTSFALLMKDRIHGLINIFASQSILLAFATILKAFLNSNNELYISALLTIILKVLFIPWLMRRLVIKLNIRHKVATITHPFLILMFATLIALFSYYLVIPIKAVSLNLNTNVIAVAMSIMLLGMLLLITHRKAVSHVIGFMAMENGIFFAALVSANGMPMVVELGIAFDVLVAAVLFGVIFFHIRSSIESLDVDRLNLLREDKQ